MANLFKRAGNLFKSINYSCFRDSAKGPKRGFDPMLPEKLSGLTLTYQLFDKPVTYKFYPNQSAKIVIDGQEVPFKFEENPYREGEWKFKRRGAFIIK